MLIHKVLNWLSPYQTTVKVAVPMIPFSSLDWQVTMMVRCCCCMGLASTRSRPLHLKHNLPSLTNTYGPVQIQ